jgi:WD40 repeat protein
MNAGSVPIEVFYSYADADEDLQRELDKHLSLLQREGLITTFHKRLVAAGQDWTETLDRHLNTASIILLLISADFVASDYCYGIEMWRAMERHDTNEACVIPILLRPCDRQSTSFGRFQPLPSNGRPVTSWSNRDEAFADIVQGIRSALRYGKPRPAPFMVEDLPANFVQRPQEFEPLILCLLDEKRDGPVAITAALRGAGGYGKTTLARATCHDERIWKKFHDGILWVTFGEQPGNLVNKIEDLLYRLNHEKPSYTSLEAATTHLVELLADREILLVLDDVWNSAHLSPFLQGGKRCARLITTRNERVVPSSVPSTQRIQVDAMQQDEAIQLLTSGIQGIEGKAHLVQHHTELKRLATRLGEWPLLLMLASSMLQERINIHKQDVARAIAAVHHALDKRGVTAFDQSNPIERSQAVAKTIEISLELLRPEEKAPYQELAIFPEDVDIPLQTLQRLWSKTSNLDEFDTEELCLRLRSLSLLLDYNSVTQTVRLHDVIRTYLQYQYTPAELTQLHTRFLDSYSMKRWANLPRNEPYLWDHLAIHLIAAGRADALVTTVMDGAYLASKASYRPISLLEEDLNLAVKQDPNNSTLSRLEHSVTNMTHLLHASQPWQECASILHSRLVHLPELQAICQSLEHRLKRPYLTAWHALPDLPMNVLKRTLAGHTDRVRACAISPDGNWLLSASDDHTLRIWDAVSGKLRHILFGHISLVNACAISPDGTWLLSVSRDSTLRIWDAASGQLLRTLTGHTHSVFACAISPDGTWLLSGSADCTLRIWDAASGQLLRTLTGHTHSVFACAISPDGTWLLSGSADCTLRIWDATSGQLLRTLTGHTHSVRACAISPDGTWLLSASDDHTLRIWDTVSGQLLHTLSAHTSLVNACAISPDGTWLLSASDDHTLRTWDAASGQLLHTLTGHTDWVRACAISPDGTWLLSTSADGTLRIWDAVSAKRHHTISSHTNTAYACAASPDSTWLLSASDDHTLRIWDTASGTIRRTLFGHTHLIRACAISPDGTRLLSASADCTLRIWDAASGQLLRILTGHTDWVRACAISPDGTWLLSASDDRTLRIWDATSGQLLRILTGHTDWVRACAISPDGTWLLSASRDSILRIWDTTTGKLRHTLSGHTGLVTACAISPDGSWLLSASSDCTLRIWDTASGTIRHTLTGHTDWVRACAISLDGHWLLSASQDGTLKIWDVTAKTRRATLRVNGPLRSCLFCGDRYHIVACGEGGVYFLRVVDE